MGDITQPVDDTMPIAVIGLSGRFAGDASNLSKLWDMCAAGRNSWSPIPEERFSKAFYHPDGGRNGSSNVRGGFFLREDLALFDGPFFGMNAAEAAALDPQQRLLLESSYEAFENAGIRMEDLAGTNTGVFVGTFCHDWNTITTEDLDAAPMYLTTGNGHAMLSNRLSYHYNISGPSITIDTACSSSLVALHLACQSLRAGECTSAVVGGVNAILDPVQMVMLSAMRFLSPDGRCYSFDHRANGYGRGEGVGCVVIKPLDQALKAGDRIRAVIRNSGVNQDAKTPGITYPSAKAQEALAKKVYAQAGLNPLDTTYIESHGTGTQAGDPVEASAIHETFSRTRSEPLMVGSIKTNVGHTEGASGVTGLIKTILMLEKEQILPNSGFEAPNKRIPLKTWNIEVPTKCIPWTRKNGILRASVSSFGFGGTNSHVIIEDARGYLGARNLIDRNVMVTTPSLIASPLANHVSPQTSQAVLSSLFAGPKTRLYTLSAYDEDTGKKYATLLRDYLSTEVLNGDDEFLGIFAATLGKHRSSLAWKSSVVASSLPELVSGLEAASFTHATKPPAIGFVFTGQGAQWYAMARSLLNVERFAKSLALSDQVIRSLDAGWSVLEELQKDELSTRVDEARLSQPLCTIVQIALVDLLRSWNIVPVSVVGHSSGEIAASYAAGFLSLQAAVSTAYYRGLVVGLKKETSETFRGAMAAVRSTQSELEALLSQLQTGIAHVACHNSPNSFTVSGDESAISELIDLCSSKDVWARKLLVNVAYHSPKMLSVAEEYRAALSAVDFGSDHSRPPTCEQFSSVTGQKIDSGDIGADYWVQNLTNPVLFSDALLEMCIKSKGRASTRSKKISSIDVVIEIGPHGALAAPVREIIKSQPALTKITYLSALSRQIDALSTVMSLASKLYDRASPVNIPVINNQKDQEFVPLLVDLPSYPWNHSTRYWCEPRAHIEYRSIKWPRHDFLGSQLKFANKLEPRWRNWMRLSEMPWLRDHRVQSLVVFPAAGYISMAIEAARQRAIDLNISISGYELREVNFSQALVIPESSGQVETMLCMKPYPESSKSSSATWDEFFVYSASDKGEWIEHCRGHISIRQSSALNAVDGQKQQDMTRLDHASQRCKAESECIRTVEGSELYAHCAKVGMEYGPIFANLVNAKVGYTHTIGKIIHPDVEKVMPSNYQSPCVMHPATLDAFFHVAIAALEGLKSAAVPTFITSVYISGDVASDPQHEFSVYGTIANESQRNPIVSLNVYDEAGSNLPSVEVIRLQMTSLSGQHGEQSARIPRKSYYRTAFRPDVSLLDPAQFAELCSNFAPTSEETLTASLIDEAFYYMAKEAVDKLAWVSISTLSSKGVDLYRSFQRIVNYIDTGASESDVTSWIAKSKVDRQTLLETVRMSGDEGNFATLVGQRFHEIICGTTDPLALTMENDALGRYYANNSRMARQYQQGAVIVDLLAHKDPHLRVLEIGAGTGGATIPMLTALGRVDSSPRFLSYEVTDITSGFFEKLQQKTAAWGDLVSYKKLDIETDPKDQGFETEHYDLVIAANVLHATRNIKRTMANVRKLLKPGGMLLLIELIPTNAGFINVFGVFDGWWLGEEKERRVSPLLSEEGWDVVLRETGFSGLDLTLADTPDARTHQGTTMMSRAIEAHSQVQRNISNSEQSRSTTPEDIVLVNTSETLEDYTQQAVQHLAKDTWLGSGRQKAVELSNLQPDGQVCILLELESSILNNMSKPRLIALKKVLSDSKGVVWVTKGASHESVNPNLSLVSGFLRTLRIETGRPLVHLDIDPDAGLTKIGGTIAKVYESVFTRGDADLEFVERNGVVLIPRHMEDDKSGVNIASRMGNSSPEVDLIPQPGRPMKLQIAQLGLLDTLYFDDDATVDDELPDGYIEVEVRATALNFRDIMMTMGQIETTSLGYECSGIVSKIGPNVQSLKVGDRVMAAGDGAFGTFFRVPEIVTFKIPDFMSFEMAATIPVAYGTAYYSLKAARLSAEDTVLIHASTGALGQALIMMCQNVGSRIFATVGTLEKKAFLMTTFRIPEDHIFYSRDSSFKEGVMRATGGKGVDVVFNSLSSELQRVTWECIAPFGRFIELGRRDFIVNSRLEQSRFRDNVTFVGLDYRHMTIARPEYVQEGFRGYMDLIYQGKLRAPKPISVFGLGEVEKAFRTMQSGKHIGKLVVVAKEGETAQVMPRKVPRTILREDATYVLVGGMGGIGRALAIRLVESGAKNLVFISRSGATTQAAKDLVNLLEESGTTIMVLRCDIGNESNLKIALEEITQQLPPIKGMFHLGMVMRSSMFENMTLEDWADTLGPKVTGTWNLHNLLPKDIDFFILISSFVGVIGNPSQAAYTAASTFQDAFSTYRNSQGLPAITVDLGLITEIGYVADREILESKLKAQGHDEISAAECLAILEEALSQPFQARNGGNLISGFSLGRFTGGDIHHAAYQTPQSSHARRLALSATTSNASKKDSGVTARVREQLRSAASLAVAEEHVLEALRGKLSTLCMIPLEDIDSARTLSYYGLDSLVAVEMRNWIASEIEATIPVLELLGNQSMSELARSITLQSRIVKKLVG